MRVSIVAAAFTLALAAAPLLADPGKNESGHGSRGVSERHYEVEREYWKRQQEQAREARQRREEHAREQRKREEEWLREERERAREWEHEHAYDYYPVPAYGPYVVEPGYPPEGVIITRSGIEVWVTL